MLEMQLVIYSTEIRFVLVGEVKVKGKSVRISGPGERSGPIKMLIAVLKLLTAKMVRVTFVFHLVNE
jgi:hypothetical protein